MCLQKPLIIRLLHRMFQFHEALKCARDVAQPSRVLTGAEGDLSFFPSVHVGTFTTTCHSNSMESDSLFWPLWALTVRYIYTQIHEIHVYENKNISL